MGITCKLLKSFLDLSRSKDGISSLHGAHHVAQKFRITNLFSNFDKVCCLFSMFLNSIKSSFLAFMYY